MFSQLKEVSKKMKIENKLCAVIFDEMALKANISFNQRRDLITGFVTNGADTKPDFSDHAQVFMLRGIVKNYKQAVSYTFSAAATKGPELAKQLKAVIKKVIEAGFIVVATICDQGTNNRQAINILMEETHAASLRLGNEPKDNTFIVDGHEIVPLYDPPHLLKCIRNNLKTKNLTYNFDGQEHIAKWDHIYELHKANPIYKGLRLVSKLTDYHVVHSKIPKMKVKFASQLFSRTVGAWVILQFCYSGYINSSPRIRSHGCQNNNPTPENFSSAFTTLLINNMSSIHAPGARMILEKIYIHL
ncbi:uncharacterized protein LOC128683403 [Plodia interpunctella]|uniref:uncharacterized protein LOC128683403 n=1 Tax=Plodia interpunctella TaxID=58824 RepID=UPI0023683BF0|nr:uncharacterized protein LOC128683403 [Plodia interpunctella]